MLRRVPVLRHLGPVLRCNHRATPSTMALALASLPHYHVPTSLNQGVGTVRVGDSHVESPCVVVENVAWEDQVEQAH
jgi:hypothetical protein